MAQKHKRRNRMPPRIWHRVAPSSAPGSLHVADGALRPTIHVIHFNKGGIQQQQIDNPDQIRGFLDSQSVTWVNVNGLAHVETLQNLGEVFKLHRLAIEDVVNVHQRPKVEEYDDHLFVVLKMISQVARLDSE